jgi:predicted DNA-binding transcriptional regulator YafY
VADDEQLSWSAGDGRRLPETTRVARLLDIIWRISSAPRYWTRKKLADAYEVSERMITDDLAIIRNRLSFGLRNAPRAGYYFDGVPQLPSVSYSLPEALALALAAEAGRHNPGIPQADLAAALGRLASVMPTELRQMTERFAAGDPPGAAPTHRQQMLTLCGQAAVSGHMLELVYAAASHGGEESRRRVEPWSVIPYDRSWQLYGFCQLRQAPRYFKVDRIKSATILPERCAQPAQRDAANVLDGGWGIMRGLDTPVEEVVLRFSATAAPWIVDEEWHPSQRLTRLPDGGVELRVTIQVTPEFQRWVLKFGREVTVHAPQSLRDWLRAEAQALLAQLDAA